MSQIDDTYAVTSRDMRKRSMSFATWKTGDVIDGGLEIRELIGQGGMGVVWRVYHREWNRELAVKMPLPALVGSPTARDRFLREAETWIDLGVHPHIVQCWFVKDISGLPSLFLDYLTGGSLKQWLTEGHVRPGQWKRILEIAIQVAEGLSYAHSRGVVHRDVKPANLLIRGDERVCVTDFGIVKTANDKAEPIAVEAGAPHSEDLGLTGTGAFLGTPQYGAPEQWGAAEGVDHSADIYALGVTLYEMACGRRPFDSDEEKVPPEVLIARHLDAKPPDPREFYADIPSEIAHLALLCLEKDPKRRPHDMDRLKGALTSIYSRIASKPYQGVGSVPKEQRADILNNRAVSLHSLGKPREARDVWRRGLRIESGHPECLYNLTKLEILAGRIQGEEGLRRLRQAKAGLPLAHLCIEEGFFTEAIGILSALNPEAQGLAPGPVQRTLGDAQMYAQQYYAAEKAYRKALGSMPSDNLSHERKRLASLGRRGIGGKILFPSADSTFNVVLSEPDTELVLDDGSNSVIGVNRTHVLNWNIDEQCVENRVARTEDATEPRRLTCSGQMLLCEDAAKFELRRLPTFALLGRKSGQILATTPDLRRMMVRDRQGPCIFDVGQSSLQRLTLPDGAQQPRKAIFDLSGELICMLLDDGRIGQPDEEGIVHPESWPEKVEEHETVVAMALSSGGTHLYLGHDDGRLQALNFATRQVDFDLDFGETITEIVTCIDSKRFLVKFNPGFAVLSSQGRLLLDGAGAATLDPKRAQVLCAPRNRLELYSLNPFRRVRVWSEHPETIEQVYLAADGRRALTRSGSGRFDVWEVDEENRVYERSFLLSPGKSFAEIVSASRRFTQSFDQAREALRRGELATSYRHLQRARSVTGYAQRPDALDLNWQLLGSLQRDSLESVWERVSIVSKEAEGHPPEASLLVGEGEKLLVSFGTTTELYHDDGKETRRLWTKDSLGKVLLMHLEVDSEGRHPREALLVNHLGVGYAVDLENAKHYQVFDINRGPLNQLIYAEQGLIFVASSGEIGFFDIRRQSTIGSYVGLALGDAEIYKFKPFTPLLNVGNELFELDLKARKKKPQAFEFRGYENDSGVSFTGTSRSANAIYVGFRDGSLLVCDEKNLKPLYHLYHDGGAITGFKLFPTIAVGLASTDQGKLVFWDLNTGETMEEFLAHRGGITSLQTSRNGRFLLTSGADEQVRLWETSWTVTEEVGLKELPWMETRKPTTKLGRFFGFGG